MLLGQLYHYDKFLDVLESQNDIESLQKTEILGLDLNSLEYKNLDLVQLKQEVRNNFSFVFEKILQENSLTSAYQFWKSVTSPLSQNKYQTAQSTDFINKLQDWEKNSLDLEDLKIILKEGKYSTNVEDFALYYGLRVIYILSKTDKTSEKESLDLNKQNFDEPNEVNPEEEIVIICDEFEAPLFTNLNCKFLPILQDHKQVLENLKKVLSENPSIKLVIVEGKETETLVKLLQKNIDPDILVTNLDLKSKNTSQKTFFDTLVKKTLGIRLPEK